MQTYLYNKQKTEEIAEINVIQKDDIKEIWQEIKTDEEETDINKKIKEEIEKQGLHLLGVVPQDETVCEYDCEGRPTAALPEDNPVKVALKEIVKKLNL